MPQPPHPHAPHPPPAPPKKTSLKLVLILAGGGAVVVLVLVAIGVYTFYASPRAQAYADAIAAAQKGKNAPGTTELRALGCKEAMVVKSEDLGNILGPAVAEGTDLAGADTSPRESVTCVVASTTNFPTCDLVARTYVGAVGERAGAFLTGVTTSDGKSVCTALYGGSGVLQERVYDGLDTP